VQDGFFYGAPVMLIRFNEVSPLGSCYEIREVEGLNTPQDFVVKGPVDARCTLKRKGDHKVEMQGHLRATLTLTCDRCLSAYDREVDTELQLLFEVESGDSWHLKDLEYNIPDLDTVPLEEPIIDLDDVLRQQLYLSVPMKNLCTEHCRGFCSRCGANLNHAECGCDIENKESPFAVLTQLKK
jgi:uncharacterized protein